MNKKLWWLLVPVGMGLSYVASAAVTGRVVAAKLDEQAALARRALPEGSLEIRVEPGLWRTTRTWTFRFGCMPTPAGTRAPLTFRWRDEIHHGPLPQLAGPGLARIDSRLELPGALAQQLKVEGGGNWALTVRTRIGFDGAFDSQVAAPAMRLEAGDQALQLSALDAHVTGHFPAGAGDIRYVTSIAPIDLQQTRAQGSMHVTVGRCDMHGKMTYDPAQASLFMPLQTDGHVSHVLVRASTAMAAHDAPGELAIGLNDVRFTQATARDGDLWSLRSHGQSALDVLGFTIDKLEIDVALQRVHEPSYLALAHKLLALNSRCDVAAPPPDPQELLAALQPDLVNLLSHAPEYAVGPLAIEVAGKRAALSYSVAARGITPEDKTQPLPALLLEKGEAHAQASMDLALIDAISQRTGGQPGPQRTSAQLSAAAVQPSAMAMMARMMLDSFVRDGYITRDADQIKAQLDFAQGRVMLNGKPFDPGSLTAP